MSSEQKKEGKPQGYLELGNDVEQYILHMMIAPGEAQDPDLVLYPYVSKDEIDPIGPPIRINVRQYIRVCIERRTRCILLMLYEHESEQRQVIPLGERDVSRLLLDLQQLLRELRKIPISVKERFSW